MNGAAGVLLSALLALLGILFSRQDPYTLKLDVPVVSVDVTVVDSKD